MMANPEHLAILKQGVKVWNEWRKKNPEIHPDLRDADIVKVDLSMTDLIATNFRDAPLSRANRTTAYPLVADLRLADFRNANLSGVDLRTADLEQADITGTNLANANLNWANLSRATFTKASLHKAYLIGTVFSETNLVKIDLAGAILGWTVFANVDLSSAAGLNTVHHAMYSTLGIDTIYLSKGKIPEVFLRGCGVPDEIIELNRSLSEKSSLYYRCFISHSGKDKRLCERLYADLQTKGVRVWYFPEDAKWGEPVWGEIDRSIKIYDKLVVVCSKNSLTSGPVLREIERALSREDKEGKNILFPVTLDSYIFEEWEHPRKADVLAKVVGDFRGWNRSAAKYDAAFKKLLKALKAN